MKKLYVVITSIGVLMFAPCMYGMTSHSLDSAPQIIRGSQALGDDTASYPRYLEYGPGYAVALENDAPLLSHRQQAQVERINRAVDMQQRYRANEGR